MQYLYLIKCQQYSKIGITLNIEERLSQLRTGNPFPLEVISLYGFSNAVIVEKALHQRFESSRGLGEWFLLTDEDRSSFSQICDLLGGEIITDIQVSSYEVLDTSGGRSDWRLLSDNDKARIEDMSAKDIMQEFGVSKSTAFAWKSK